MFTRTIDSLPENVYQTQYRTENLHDYNYQNWSFQCHMLLSEKQVWKVINGKKPCPTIATKYETKCPQDDKLTDTRHKNIQKEIDEWLGKDEEALQIISFTVSDQLQGPIHHGKMTKGT